MGEGEAIADLVLDADDPRLDDFRNVPDAELVRRRGVFIAEGRFVVERLLRTSPLTTRAVMATKTVLESMAAIFDARPEVPVYVVPSSVMDKVAGFHVHRGCLALGEYPGQQSWQNLVPGASTVLVLERIANADNVGGIFRSAAAFGADAILLDEATTDPLYRKSIRTSMGATMAVPFARMTPWPDSLAGLRHRGFAVVAMTLSPAAASPHEMTRRIAGRPVALVFGHEGDGVSESAAAACEFETRIPIASNVDSLNVAAAATVVLYALTCQS